MNRELSRSKSMALGGLLGAITVICVYFATILPTSKLSLYFLSSLAVAVLILEAGTKTAWIFYGATSFLVLIVVPEKLATTPYILFFGLYGILKYYLERGKKSPVEYIIKFAYFNTILIIALFLVRWLFISDEVFNKYPIWMLIVAAQGVFLIYDYVYTLFIRYYIQKIRHRLKG